MMPLVANNALAAIDLLADALDALCKHCLCKHCLQGLRIGRPVGTDAEPNPSLVTALVPHISHELAAKLAARCVADGVSVLDISRRDTDLHEATVRRFLDPARPVGEFGRPEPADDAATPKLLTRSGINEGHGPHRSWPASAQCLLRSRP